MMAAQGTNPRSHHSLAQPLSAPELVAAFGTSETKALVREVQRMGQRDLQARFRLVYGTPTFSNNNCWLRRKLLEAAGIHAPPKAAAAKPRHGGAKKAKDAGLKPYRPELKKPRAGPRPSLSHTGSVRRTQRVPKLKYSSSSSYSREASDDQASTATPTSEAYRGSTFSDRSSTATPSQSNLLWGPSAAHATCPGVLLAEGPPAHSGSASTLSPGTPEQSPHASSTPLFAGGDLHRVAQMAGKLLDEDFIFCSDDEAASADQAQPSEAKPLLVSDSLNSAATACGAFADELPDWALLPLSEPLPDAFDPEMPELQDALTALIPPSVFPQEPQAPLASAQPSPRGPEAPAWHAAPPAPGADSSGGVGNPMGSVTSPLGGTPQAAPKELSGPAYRVYKQLRPGGEGVAVANQPLLPRQHATLQPSDSEARLLSLFESSKARAAPPQEASAFSTLRRHSTMGAITAMPEAPAARTLSGTLSCPLPNFGKGGEGGPTLGTGDATRALTGLRPSSQTYLPTGVPVSPLGLIQRLQAPRWSLGCALGQGPQGLPVSPPVLPKPPGALQSLVDSCMQQKPQGYASGCL